MPRYHVTHTVVQDAPWRLTDNPEPEYALTDLVCPPPTGKAITHQETAGGRCITPRRFPSP